MTSMYQTFVYPKVICVDPSLGMLGKAVGNMIKTVNLGALEFSRDNRFKYDRAYIMRAGTERRTSLYF